MVRPSASKTGERVVNQIRPLPGGPNVSSNSIARPSSTQRARRPARASDTSADNMSAALRPITSPTGRPERLVRAWFMSAKR